MLHSIFQVARENVNILRALLENLCSFSIFHKCLIFIKCIKTMPLIFFTSTNFFCLDTVFCYPFLVRKYKKKDVQIEKTTIYTKNHWINETLDKNDEKYGKYYEKAKYHKSSDKNRKYQIQWKILQKRDLVWYLWYLKFIMLYFSFNHFGIFKKKTFKIQIRQFLWKPTKALKAKGKIPYI